MALIGIDTRTVAFSPVLGAGGRVARGLAKIASLAGATGLALAIATVLVTGRGAPEAVRAEPSDAARWIDIRRPLPMFDLVGTEFAKLPRRYEARRQSGAGGRRDTLTFGDAGADGPFLRLVFDRLGEGAAPARPLAAELAEMALRDGTIALPDRPAAALATRFGQVDVVDVRFSAGAGQRSCQGFRVAPGAGAVLRIAGLACSARGVLPGHSAPACVVDRIDLIEAADDSALQRIFVDAEHGRGAGCGGERGTASHADAAWLAADAAPPALRRLEEVDALARPAPARHAVP